MNVIEKIPNVRVDQLLNELTWHEGHSGDKDYQSHSILLGDNTVTPTTLAYANKVPVNWEYSAIRKRLSSVNIPCKHPFRWPFFDKDGYLCYAISSKGTFIKRAFHFTNQEVVWDKKLYPSPLPLTDCCKYSKILRLIERDDMLEYMHSVHISATSVKGVTIVLRRSYAAMQQGTPEKEFDIRQVLLDNAIKDMHAKECVIKDVPEVVAVGPIEPYPGMTSWDIKFNLKQR